MLSTHNQATTSIAVKWSQCWSAKDCSPQMSTCVWLQYNLHKSPKGLVWASRRHSAHLRSTYAPQLWLNWLAVWSEVSSWSIASCQLHLFQSVADNRVIHSKAALFSGSEKKSIFNLTWKQLVWFSSVPVLDLWLFVNALLFWIGHLFFNPWSRNPPWIN